MGIFGVLLTFLRGFLLDRAALKSTMERVLMDFMWWIDLELWSSGKGCHRW
jgi:hypothetical protein